LNNANRELAFSLKMLSTPRGREAHQKWPLKSGPSNMNSARRIATKKTAKKVARAEQKRTWTDQARAAKKPPQKTDPEGQQENQYPRRSQKPHAQHGPQNANPTKTNQHCTPEKEGPQRFTTLIRNPNFHSKKKTQGGRRDPQPPRSLRKS
jgi:hypothetical protein